MASESVFVSGTGRTAWCRPGTGTGTGTGTLMAFVVTIFGSGMSATSELRQCRFVLVFIDAFDDRKFGPQRRCHRMFDRSISVRGPETMDQCFPSVCFQHFRGACNRQVRLHDRGLRRNLLPALVFGKRVIEFRFRAVEEDHATACHLGEGCLA